jgi:signal transduction histidine kinase
MSRLSGAPNDPCTPDVTLPGGALLSRLGHELRSPLSGIIGLTRILLVKPPTGQSDAESQVRQLGMVQASAVQMLRTVEQVVDIAKLQARESQRDPTPFDCRDVVAGALHAQRLAADRRGLRLLAEIPNDPVILLGDPDTLQRLLRELLDNAVKFTGDGDVRIRIRSADGEAVAIEVSDDGPTIPVGEQTRIFDAFERGEAALLRDDGSAGLGLYLARQLAHQLNAALTLSGGDDPGPTFAVEFPRVRAPAPALSSQPRS